MSSGATSVYGLPYPIQTDPVDVAADVQSLATNVETQLLLKAPLASPTFTGTVIAPTPNDSDNTTKVATTAFVKNQSYLTTTAAASTYAPIASYALLASPTFTGTPAAPTASADTNTTQLATTAFVVGQASSSSPAMNGSVATGTSLKYARADHVHPSDTSKADISSPAFLGVPTSTTATFGTSTTQLATTAFVQTAISQVAIVPNSTGIVTPALSDAGSIITTSSASTVTCTLPSDTTTAFPVGTQITFIQRGTGNLVFVAGSGATIESTPGLKLRTRYSVATATKVSSNNWSLYGDLTV